MVSGAVVGFKDFASPNILRRPFRSLRLSLHGFDYRKSILEALFSLHFVAGRVDEILHFARCYYIARIHTVLEDGVMQHFCPAKVYRTLIHTEELQGSMVHKNEACQDPGWVLFTVQGSRGKVSMDCAGMVSDRNVISPSLDGIACGLVPTSCRNQSRRTLVRRG